MKIFGYFDGMAWDTEHVFERSWDGMGYSGKVEKRLYPTSHGMGWDGKPVPLPNPGILGIFEGVLVVLSPIHRHFDRFLDLQRSSTTMRSP